MVRLASVLEVIYLVFNEGYAATAGEDWMRPSLCDEALRLGRVLATLVPAEAEAHGLVALMELQASRFRARVGPARRGDPAARSGSRAVGSAADRTRPGRARSRHRARRRRRLLRAAGRHRRLSRARGDAPRPPTGRASRRSTRGSPTSRDRRSCASTTPSPWAAPMVRRLAWSLVDALAGDPSLQAYPYLPQRARRSARTPRPRRGGARRIRSRRHHDAQRPRPRCACSPAPVRRG